MVDESAERTEARLSGHAGLSAEINANGSLRRFDCGDISLSLFVGNELEGGPANLYLRMVGDDARCIPLLGPNAPTWFETDPKSGRFTGTGSWHGVEYSVELVLSKSATAWFWHVQLANRSASAQVLDITYAQDLALAPYGAVRMNEFYVSQYVDHTPLSHPTQGLLDALTVRQVKGDFAPLRVLIAGDISHSRVARSAWQAFTTLGAHVTLVAPPTLLPPCVDDWPVDVSHDLDAVLSDLDVLYLLRVQRERMDDALLPSLREYSTMYGLTTRRAGRLPAHSLVMHPGPMNRGVEMVADPGELPGSVILDQVTNGVAVRMAVLFRLLGSGADLGGEAS